MNPKQGKNCKSRGHGHISVLCFVMVIVALAISGCTEGPDRTLGDDTGTMPGKGVMVPAGGLGDINRSLESGPVLVMVGYESCPACVAQKPIMQEIAAEYEGRATVMYIDTKKVGALGFDVYYVPDSFIVVGIDNGKYMYMKNNITTLDRKEAQFIGITKKADLTQTLDMALGQNSK